jgi:hypothetical protein
VSGQLQAPDALPAGKEPPVTHWIGDWVAPEPIWRRENSWLYLYSNSDPSVVQTCSQSLYRLRYSASPVSIKFYLKYFSKRLLLSRKPVKINYISMQRNNIHVCNLHGHATAQADNSRLLTSADRKQSQVTLCVIYGGQGSNGTGFLFTTPHSSPNSHSIKCFFFLTVMGSWQNR